MKLSLVDRYFSFMDKRLPSDRLILYTILIFFVSALAYFFFALNDENTVTSPTSGGTLTEGIIGTPRFVNPVLAITRADHDLVELTYSGLLRLDTDGALSNDIAESVTISDDGLVYNVLLKNNISFHDGENLSAEDVAFTIALIQDQNLKSPLRGNWSGVVVEVTGDHELNFVLETPYTPFLENLTVGILPKHIWGSLTIEELPFSQFNTEPIGSGPFSLQSVVRTKAGLISEYNLTVFTEHVEPAKISEVIVRFYQNEEGLIEAFEAGDITSTAAFSYQTLAALPNQPMITQPLPRIFSVFFNQNKSIVVRQEEVREALEAVIDREALITDVLAGFGTPAYSPIPIGFIPDVEATTTEAVQDGRAILEEAGWEINDENGRFTKIIDEATTTLSITLTTANSRVFEDTAKYLETVWTQLGAEVRVELFEQGDLTQSEIRPRDYEALLFGADIGRSLDFYPFWHSSQREDPGLNVALYTNITADELLEDIRVEQDTQEQIKDLQAFEAEVVQDTPAIFLYSPLFVYVLDEKTQAPALSRIARNSERFSNINQWFINERSTWPLFTDE